MKFKECYLKWNEWPIFVIALSLSYIWVDNIGYHFKKGTNNKIIIWRILRRRPIIWKWYIPFCAILRSVQSLNCRNWRSSGMWICVWPWGICCRITRFIRSVLITWFTMESSQNEKRYNRFTTHFAYMLAWCFLIVCYTAFYSM